ncbi:MAG: hypothetical protein WB820_18615, partial [Rhodoplanes sp.]
SCEVPHDTQYELLKKTGMEQNCARSMCIPVETGLPVLAQRIMSSPIARSGLSMMKVTYRAEMKGM